jgi:phosphatidylinositol glycan class M
VYDKFFLNRSRENRKKEKFETNHEIRPKNHEIFDSGGAMSAKIYSNFFFDSKTNHINCVSGDGKLSVMTAWIETVKRPLTIYIAAVALRLALILFGEYQDANFAVKYTDVDYMVYTDAARFVTLGESPFRRATYRYTPYLAWLLTPNILIHPAFGKLCFAALDLLVAILIERLLVLSMPKKNSTTIAACLIAWLFNPFVFTVSTRGNADVLIAALVLASLYCLLTRKLFWGSIWYGLAVHFKIYPIYFVLAILLYLDNTYGVDKPATVTKPSLFTRIMTLNQFINRPRVIFALVSFTTFAVLTAVAYAMYDFEFVYETYLYHLVRKDNRHNFSVYFYHLYLRFEAASAGVTSLLAFLPQVRSLRVARIIAFSI